MRVNNKKQAVCLIFVMGLVGLGLPASAAVVRPGAPALVAAWAKLDAGRGYRQDFGQRTSGGGKDHATLITDYTTASSDAYPSKTPRQLFLDAAAAFRAVRSSPSLADEAALGLQESLNETMAGQSLLGNDFLIKGLRVRFPGTEPADDSQTSYLSQSIVQFQTAIDEAAGDLRRDPNGLRSGGLENSSFPFWVENTVPPGGGQDELVENELYRFTDLVDRAALARNSLGKRLFFFGNVKDEDNFPYGNFPGQEDLDLNNNGILDAAGREEAAHEFKRSAQATYLHSVLLAAVQTPAQFDQNNGYQLKRRILDANRVYEDILAGFNPLQLLGDFVPHQSFSNFLGLCEDAIGDAAWDEGEASRASRTYDQDRSALTTELRDQQGRYIDEIEALTGLASVETAYDLSDPEERDRLLADAEASARQGNGALGGQLLAIQLAGIDAKQAEEALRQIPEKIRIEEQRNGQVATVVSVSGLGFAALSLMDSVAGQCSVSAGVSIGVAASTSTGVSCNPGAEIQGFLRGGKDILAALKEATISGINSAATVKQYLLDGAQAALSVERAGKLIEQQQAHYAEMLAQLQRTIRGYVAAQEDLADAYFANPAYRVARDRLIQMAEVSFATAMEQCYVAAKALEYFWSEPFNNPVSRLDGGLPESLSLSSDPFIRAESVFAAKFARAGSPNLDDFRDALGEWDSKMQQLRSPTGQSSSQLIRIRRDILGYDGGDEGLNRLLFKDFIAKHRVAGRNPNVPDLIFEFSIEIADQKLFPDHPNIKIDEIRVNLIESPARSLYGPDATGEPASVDLVMLDEAVVRTFFAELPDDDDLIIYDLQEGRSLSKSPFSASVDATIGGFSNPPAIPNTQLADHSPAVTRWTLRMQMDRGNNEHLLLEHLDEIEITFLYSFGKPQGDWPYGLGN